MLIRALADVRRTVGTASLTIVGDGPERVRLERLVGELGLDGAVELVGRVPDSQKAAILERSDLLLACSVREGWGLTPTEAARLGTPAVAYDIPGLRDSVLDGRTGLLDFAGPGLARERGRPRPPRRAALRVAARARVERLARALLGPHGVRVRAGAPVSRRAARRTRCSGRDFVRSG